MNNLTYFVGGKYIMTYENVEYALQEASKYLGSNDPDEIQKGLGWAIYALARKGVPDPRKATEKEMKKSEKFPQV